MSHSANHNGTFVPPLRVVALIPVYNDWDCVNQLLPRLNEAVLGADFHLDVLLIDDCSADSCPEDLGRLVLPDLGQLSVLRLRRNLGHQRAIAIGLAHIEASVPCDAVLIMDGDGEDDPNDVVRLVQRMLDTGGSRIIFAERTQRSEGLVFRAGYCAYRLLHRVMTGLTVRMGNFSVVPRPLLRRLVVLSELWNHYAAAVLKARVPHERVPTVRSHRLVGRSHMNFVSLVVHGLSALSVFSEMIGVRLLVMSCLLTGALTAVLGVILGVRVLTDLAIPGWASTVGGLALVLVLQTVLMAVSFSFIVLQGRGNTTFLPTRDYTFFIDQVDNLSPHASETPEAFRRSLT